MKAIERIAGYACEVNEEQWQELVKVADEVGFKCPFPEWYSDYTFAFIGDKNELDAHETIKAAQNAGLTLIPYPDFLAKLKGEEKWEPKNGGEVECRDGLGADWFLAKFVGYDGKWAVCRPEHRPLGYYTTHNDVNIRPLRPTITRAEAEHALGKRIVD